MRLQAALSLLVLLPLAGKAAAQAPVYKDLERFERHDGPVVVAPHVIETRRSYWRVERGPPRLTDRGPGYVGSAWGLGKPNSYGLAPRPDDGYLY
jgi:hypothetical protein